MHIQKDNPLKLEILHFLDCINGKATPFVSNATDVKALSISLQAVEIISKQLRK